MILFAKSPYPGRVKTRLAKSIGIEQAAELHTAFVADCIVRTNELAHMGLIDVELHTDDETDAWGPFGVTIHLQANGDLGRRMFLAMQTALAQGRPQVMILGTDAPTLPVGHLVELLCNEADVALGPTADGGYYAICSRRVDAEMFRSVNWSTASTLSDTESSCINAGLRVWRGSPWYDVDDITDLARLRSEGGLPEHTARALEKIYGGQGSGD